MYTFFVNCPISRAIGKESQDEEEKIIREKAIVYGFILIFNFQVDFS